MVRRPCCLIPVIGVSFFVIAVVVHTCMNEPASRTVISRHMMIDDLCRSLNRYYLDNGVYPKELVGHNGIAVCSDTRTVTALDVNNGETLQINPTSSKQPDELERGGYIRVWGSRKKDYAFAYPPEADGLRGAVRKRRWVCAVSAANDERAKLVKRMRYLALGGIAGTMPATKGGNVSERTYEEYTLIPGYLDTCPLKSMSYFGYVRDDLEGGEPGTCRVWVYGDYEISQTQQHAFDGTISVFYPEYPKAHPYKDFRDFHPLGGFDVLNARTGAIEPDGVPDGVCMIAWLKDGQVIEEMKNLPGQYSEQGPWGGRIAVNQDAEEIEPEES